MDNSKEVFVLFFAKDPFKKIKKFFSIIFGCYPNL